MKDKNNKFKNSLLSYFEAKKNGESLPDLKFDKLKAQPPKKIPNKITPNPSDDDSAQTNKKISDLGGSINNLIKAIADVSGSSSILKKSIITNNTINNSISKTRNDSNKTSNNRMDIFNDIHKTFKKNVINNPSKNIKNTKEIQFPKIPLPIVSNNTEKSEKFVENIVSTENTKEKLNKVSKELSHKLIKMNKPKRQYKATSASNRVPKIVELTNMSENNKNVFKNLSNKMMTVVPGKTSSKILSTLMNYYQSSGVYTNKTMSSENYNSMNTIPTEKHIHSSIEKTNPTEKYIHSSIEKTNMKNVVGKQKYNIINVPALAEGGIVDRPTLAMIGEGGRPESVQPLDRSTKNIQIQKTQTPTASSVGGQAMNANAALKLEQTQANAAAGNNSAPIVKVDNTTSTGKSNPPPSASFSQSPSKSLMAIQTQTHFPRWRRTRG